MGTQEHYNLVKEYKRVAKKADRQLRNLEALAENELYSGVLDFSYRNAMHDIHKKFGDDTNRFDKSLTAIEQLTTNELRSMIAKAKMFSNSTSSTKRGIDRLYKQRAETLNKKYGTHLTWQQLWHYFNDTKWEKISDMYYIEIAMKNIAESEKQVTDIDERIKNGVKKSSEKHLTDEEFNAIYKNLQKNGVKPI